MGNYAEYCHRNCIYFSLHIPEVILKTSALFADQFRFYPMRLFSQSWLRRWFLKRSGPESGPFDYRPDLTRCKRVLLLLPEQDAPLFVLLPLVLEIAAGKTSEELLILTEERHRHLLRAIGLESFAHFGSGKGMRYGESEFESVSRRIQAQPWDLCLYLRREFVLTDLFLAKISMATYRIGVVCESAFPFLNISLRPSNVESAYALRTLLYQQFRLDSESIAHHALDAGKRRSVAAHSEPVHLSSSNVLLLNLEVPLEGERWSVDEVTRLCEALASKFRILALASDPAQLAPYSAALESLQVRIAPVPSTSGALFDMLRQYKGVLTLNTAHAHLFMNLSSVRVVLLNGRSESPWYPPAEPQLRICARNEDFHTLAQSVAAFMG